MYSFISGIIEDIMSNGVVVENNGIGYFINVANPFSFRKNETVKIYVYNKISEDEYSLFGFKTMEERDMFLKLISVKGLGPKIALGMFANGDMSLLINAIDSSNVTYLTKYPKVGEKLARQIILDLKGKLVKGSKDDMDDASELISALTNLGYKNSDVKNVIKNINRSESLENQIKEALKLLLKG